MEGCAFLLGYKINQALSSANGPDLADVKGRLTVFLASQRFYTIAFTSTTYYCRPAATGWRLVVKGAQGATSHMSERWEMFYGFWPTANLGLRLTHGHWGLHILSLQNMKASGTAIEEI